MHPVYLYRRDESPGKLSEVPGESYWVKTGQHWVVDEPAQEEQGHWEYR